MIGEILVSAAVLAAFSVAALISVVVVALTVYLRRIRPPGHRGVRQ